MHKHTVKWTIQHEDPPLSSPQQLCLHESSGRSICLFRGESTHPGDLGLADDVSQNEEKKRKI